ncbi:MAG: hypothetical protein K2M15_03940 [Oscillospiraceae bacterium]|nr:hypothetical protein [Oscillospiraceae bacterium]MDE7170961.1 hypothetical protein [Oscillospiraceae bacterium]
MRKQKAPWGALLRALLLPAIIVAVLVFFSTALNSIESGRGEENKRQLEQALRRGCVACYAAEGIYPPDIDYLKEHYGVQVDETQYVVFYTAFADNLMPDITVLEQTP